MTAVAGVTLEADLARLADALVQWLESAERPGDLFADDVFLDLSLPHWRLQEAGVHEAVGIREAQHPWPGSVRVEALDATSRGFLVQVEERWEAEGQQWYCRELMHAVVSGGRIAELHAYCTGDWDAEVQRRHRDQVRLVRP